MNIKRRPGRYIEQPTERICKMCTTPKPITEFQAQNLKRNGGRPTYRKSCLDCERKKALARYYARQADGNCAHCGARRTAEELVTCRTCRDKNTAAKAESHLKLRSLVLTAYGRKCSHCGDPRLECLELHHVGGWGKEQRAEMGGRFNGYALWKWIRDNNFPASISLLCGSCHSALSYWGSLPKRVFDFNAKMRQAPISTA